MATHAATRNISGLARALAQHGVMSEHEAEALQTQAQTSGASFVETVLLGKRLTAVQLAVFASRTFGNPLLDLASFDLDHIEKELVDLKMAQSRRVLPLYKRNNKLYVAISDPANLQVLDEVRFKKVCDSVREDGAYVEAGENDNLIVQKLESNPSALGIFGYSYLEENQDKLAGSLLEGVSPVFETIASGKYPASRPLFIYVKKAHIGVIPGIKEFVTEYVSDKALGQEGYLADKGLIPPSDAERAKIRTDALAFKNVKL